MINTCFPLTDEDVPENEHGQKNKIAIFYSHGNKIGACSEFYPTLYTDVSPTHTTEVLMNLFVLVLPLVDTEFVFTEQSWHCVSS